MATQKMSVAAGLMVLIVSMIWVPNLMADPFVGYPGTRARGMGAAYCAVADDVTAIWYNPAGLAVDTNGKRNRFGAQFEYSETMDEVDDANYFVGASWAFKQWGIGLALYSPYAFWGGDNLRIFSIGAARSWSDNLIKAGLTADFITLSGKDEDAKGMSYSAGILIEPIGYYLNWAQEHSVRLRLGFNYRTETMLNNDKQEEIVEEEGLNPSPRSSSYAVSLYKGITPLRSHLILSYEHNDTSWEEEDYYAFEAEYDRESFGVEWAFAFSGNRSFIRNIAFRAGTYEVESDDSDDDELSANTFGVGVKMGEKGVAIELCLEKREWGQTDEDLMSFAIVIDNL